MGPAKDARGALSRGAAGAHRRHQLIAVPGRAAFGALAHAVPHVVVEKPQRDLVERGVNGTDWVMSME